MRNLLLVLAFVLAIHIGGRLWGQTSKTVPGTVTVPLAQLPPIIPTIQVEKVERHKEDKCPAGYEEWWLNDKAPSEHFFTMSVEMPVCVTPALIESLKKARDGK